MNTFDLLDCTLRDGGYINDWCFGYETIKTIIKKLVSSKVEFIEVGFLRNCLYNKDFTLFNNINEMKEILPDNVGNSKIVLMALHNMYDISKLEENDGSVYAIRVTFHDYDIDEGLKFCEEVMKKGYKCFCNPINIMGYSDSQILQIIEKVNKIKPYALSLVDTFGSMMREDLVRIYSLVENNLDENISVGLHLHENLSLSYSLAQEFIKIKASRRKSVIDASLLGMGRVPGNLCIELMMDYLNKYEAALYDVEYVFDAIDRHIKKIKEKCPWGYSTEYSLSAKYNLHRNYAEYLIDKGKLSTKDINQILSKIDNSKKAVYDEQYIEKLYYQNQDNMIDDNLSKEKIKNYFGNKDILIIAPGKSIIKYREEIDEYIEKNNPVVIMANFVNDKFKSDFVFFSNRIRYDKYQDIDNNNIQIITSNITTKKKSDIVVNYHDLVFKGEDVFDNCVIMLLGLLESLDIYKVSIAGFDGFEGTESDFIDTSLSIDEEVNLQSNDTIKKIMSKIGKKIDINYVTSSLYQ